MVEVVSEEHAVDDFVGFRVAYRQHDVLDQAAVAGGVDSVDFGGYVVPVVGDRFDAPVFMTEQIDVVKSELIEIDFASYAIEADWFVPWEQQVHLYICRSSPHADQKH
ncbi:hypothetical protein D3C76_855650 [compost metagenome]